MDEFVPELARVHVVSGWGSAAVCRLNHEVLIQSGYAHFKRQTLSVRNFEVFLCIHRLLSERSVIFYVIQPDFEAPIAV